ncbi:MAG: SDR family NAD(P)-dependent oxidoreductase [Gammaproteobacteria bacterium]|nr:SDR family NAD(P)-dependent oxidoreductase [Gammaproteobacteria bacterium]
MQKTILITGATDGIGLASAKMLVQEGHRLLLHGRDPRKLEDVKRTLAGLAQEGQLESYVADLSRMSDVEALAQAVLAKHPRLDVLINNAGVFRTPNAITRDHLDVRFVVNTLAPYLLTQHLLPALGAGGRVINLSSAAQAPVNLDALAGRTELADGAAYAQSKLALTMWSRTMALQLQDKGPAIIAVNPGSMLASKMVREAYGVSGSDIRIGADILTRAALADEFAAASGQYFDNDARQFAAPHPDALDSRKCAAVLAAMETILAKLV